MYQSKWTVFLCQLLASASLTIANPISDTPSLTVRSESDIVERAPGAEPSNYPYGPTLVNEPQYLNWDPNDNGQQKADAGKIHNGYDDMINMVYFAWVEADRKSDTFKRWFDEGDADNVKKVLEKIIDPKGVGQANPLMTQWVCQQDDEFNRCTGTSNAWSASTKGIFHMCPKGLQLPNIRDLQCSDLDGYASRKMASVAFTMMHEATHWIKIGDDALGKHITDIRPGGAGAYDCTQLSAADKLINAQNYAFLGAEAYFLRKQCTFTDPPPGTVGTNDSGDEVDGTSQPQPQPTSVAPAPPPYNTGTCCFHLEETQIPCLGDSNNLLAYVKMVDDKKLPIGETQVSNGEAGVHIDDGNPYSFTSKLLNPLVITGEHQNDYVQFTIGGLSWQSTTPNGGASCSVGGWDPRSGPTCGRFGTKPAKNNMDCCFPCDGKT